MTDYNCQLIDFTSYGCKIKIAFSLASYISYNVPGSDPNIAIDLLEYIPEHGGYFEPYAHITANLRSFSYADQAEGPLAYLDENNLPGIGKWMEKHGFAEPCNEYFSSGWVDYPLYKINLPAMQPYVLEDIRKGAKP